MTCQLSTNVSGSGGLSEPTVSNSYAHRKRTVHKFQLRSRCWLNNQLPILWARDLPFQRKWCRGGKGREGGRGKGVANIREAALTKDAVPTCPHHLRESPEGSQAPDPTPHATSWEPQGVYVSCCPRRAWLEYLSVLQPRVPHAPRPRVGPASAFSR